MLAQRYRYYYSKQYTMTAQFKTEMEPGLEITMDLEVLGKSDDLCLVITIMEEAGLGSKRSKIMMAMNGREARQLVGVLKGMIA